MKFICTTGKRINKKEDGTYELEAMTIEADNQEEALEKYYQLFPQFRPPNWEQK